MPIIRINGKSHECIDTLKIFDNQAIKTALAGEGIEYRTNKLDEISKAVLGESEGGKLEDLDGIEIQKLPIEKQKEYCLRDSELVMKLIQYKDGNQKIMKMLKYYFSSDWIKSNSNMSWHTNVLVEENIRKYWSIITFTN